MQTRLRDYQDPLLSFEHNLINLGVHRPGRFNGFDKLTVTGQLQFDLEHSVDSGLTVMDQDALPLGPIGVMMSTQGMLVVEDAKIPGLVMVTNATNPFPRIDYIVMTHQYVEVPGGLDATYEVLKGADGGPVAPTLSPFQTIVGQLDIPASVNSVALATYTKATCPDSGDQPDAKLTAPNTFKKINQFAFDVLNNTAPEVIISGLNLWGLSSNGNTFLIEPSVDANVDGLRIKGVPINDGTEIILVLNEHARLVQNRSIPIAQVIAGYAPIAFSSRLATSSLVVGPETFQVLQPPSGILTRWFVTLIRVQGVWYVKAVDGINYGDTSSLKVTQKNATSMYKDGADVGMSVTVAGPAVESLYPKFDGDGYGYVEQSKWIDTFTLDYAPAVTRITALKKCILEVEVNAEVLLAVFSATSADQGQVSLRLLKFGGSEIIISSNIIDRRFSTNYKNYGLKGKKIINLEPGDIWMPYINWNPVGASYNCILSISSESTYMVVRVIG